MMDINSLIEHHLDRLIEKRGGHGKLLGRLISTSRRWQWWVNVLESGRIPYGPIPQILFAQNLQATGHAYKNIEQMLKPYQNDYFHAWHEMVDWILFSFGSPRVKNIDHVKPGRAEHWEKTFDLHVHIQMDPGDWFGHYYEQNIASGGLKSNMGFFSTPPNVARLMAEITMDEADIISTSNEPCCGTGRIMLEMSNFTVNLSGQDANPAVVKVCEINGWLYMPSLIRPAENLKLGPNNRRWVHKIKEKANG